MLDILVSIGAIVLSNKLCKWMDAKSESIKHNRDCDKAIATIKADYDIEKQTEDYVRSGKNVHNIYEALEDNLLSAFGDDYLEKFILPGVKGYYLHRGGEPADTAYWAKHLLLAKKGKVASDPFYFGFPIGGGENKDFSIKMCKEIERNLKNAGVEFGLMIEGRDERINPEYGSMKLDFHTVLPPERKIRLW